MIFIHCVKIQQQERRKRLTIIEAFSFSEGNSDITVGSTMIVLPTVLFISELSECQAFMAGAQLPKKCVLSSVPILVPCIIIWLVKKWQDLKRSLSYCHVIFTVFTLNFKTI